MRRTTRRIDDVREFAEMLITCSRVLLPILTGYILVSHTRAISFSPIPLHLTAPQFLFLFLVLHALAIIKGFLEYVSRGFFYELSSSLLSAEIILFLYFFEHEPILGLILLSLLLGGLIAILTCGRNVLCRLYEQQYIPQSLMNDIIAASNNRAKSHSLTLVAVRRYLVMATAVVFAVPSLLTLTVYGFEPPEEQHFVGSAHALENLSSDNMLLSNLSTIALFEENVWQQLGDQEKIDALQVIADIETHHLRIEPVMVVAASLGGPILGAYDYNRRHVRIDLDKHTDMKGINTINTILHECRHAYQFDCVDAADWTDSKVLDGIYFEELRQWLAEQRNPIDYADDAQGYYSMAIEQDAREYADEGCDDYYYCLQFVNMPSR